MVPGNIIMLTNHRFTKYLGIKFSSLFFKECYSIPKNKFGKLETNTPLEYANSNFKNVKNKKN